MNNNDQKDKYNKVMQYMKESAAVSNSHFIYNDFVGKAEMGNIPNDGSDTLLSLIDKYVIEDKDKKFYKVLKSGTELFRARAIIPGANLQKIEIDGDILKGFDEADSREAPLGKSSEGRNNIHGVGYFYCSKKEITACVEIKPNPDEMISVAKFETVKDLNMIDFTAENKMILPKKLYDKKGKKFINLNTLFIDIMSNYFKPVSDPQKYAATQFLSDYIRKTGVDGICYRSYYDKDGINYVIFNSHHQNIKFIESHIIFEQGVTRHFITANEGKVYTVSSIDFKEKGYQKQETLQKARNEIISAKNRGIK
jgi:hypothetical protein